MTLRFRGACRWTTFLVVVFLLGVCVLPTAQAQVIENETYTGPKTTIRWAFWGGERTVQVYRRVCERFVEQNPRIAIDVSIYPWGQYWQKLQTQAAAGLAPDVMSLVSATAGVWINHNALLSLEDFVDTSAVDLSKLYPGAVNNYRWNGELYALPMELAVYALVYSIDRFEERGIPSEEWPKPDQAMTWEEYTALARKLTLRDERGNVVQYATASGDWWNHILFGLYGGEFVDRRVDPRRPTIIGNDSLRAAVTEVFQHIHAERIQAPPSVLLTSDFGGDQVLRSSRFSMAYHGPFVLQRLRENGIRFGVTPVPRGAFPIQSMSVNAVGIYAESEHPQEAWAFIQFLASAEAQSMISTTLRSAPVHKEANTAFLGNEYGIPQMEAFLDDLDRARPFMSPSVTYVEKAFLTWLQRVDTELDVEYGRRLRALQQDRAAVSEQDYAAFVDQMRAVVETTVRERLPELDADFRDAFARAQPPESGASGRVLLPIMIMLFFGGCFLAYLGYVRRQEGEVKTTATSGTNWSAYLCLSPWLIGFVFFTVGPIFASILLSFTEWNMISNPIWVGAQHYLDLFNDQYFTLGIKKTFIYAALVIPISLIGGIFTAGLLTSNVKGADSFKAIFYFPSLFTGAAAAVLWVNMFHKEYGIINRILSVFGTLPINWLDEQHAFYTVVLMNVFWIGGATIIYYAGMKQIPRTLYEAAEIDGAGLFRRFFSITLPLLSPVILFMVIMTTIGAFQVFTPALFFVDYPSQIGGPGDALRFYAVNIYDEAFNNLHMGKACAWAFVLFIIIFVVTMVQIKLSKRFVYTET